MIHRYVRYNGYGLTIWVSFMVNVCVCVRGGFGFNGFMTKVQLFPIDGHYKTDVISGVGHLRLDSVMQLLLRIVCVTPPLFLNKP
jgi:hypothetical protein